MSDFICLLRRSGSVRSSVLILLLAFCGGTLLTLASLRPRDAEPIDRAAYDRLMATRIHDLDDLLLWFYDQQDQWVRIIPPGLEELIQPGSPDLLVLDSDALQKLLANSKPTWRNSVPVWELELRENINGELTIRDTSGNVLHTVPAPTITRFPTKPSSGRASTRCSTNPG